MTEPSRPTIAVRTGIDQDRHHGAVVPPIVLSSTFSFQGYEGKRDYDYTRSGNPTRALLLEALAGLEGGAGGVITPSGMAAITLVVHTLTRPGDVIVVPHDCYGGSWRLFDALAEKGVIGIRVVDLGDPNAYRAALHADPAPAVVWIETPSNPLLRLTDIAAAAEAAHAVGAQVVADNTFLTPVLQRPFELGADVVVHSTTKYLNGHSDVVQGAALAARAGDAEQLDWWANVLGLTGSPFDSYLCLRGLRSLYARMRVHQENAQAVAEAAHGHPAVAQVYYPGLASSSGHALAQRQQDGFGAMVSLDLAGGTEAVRAFVDGLRYFTLAESLGGVESLVAHPATMTHASMTPEARHVAGIGDGLVRLSVGIEDRDDLLADLRAALDRAAGTGV